MLYQQGDVLILKIDEIPKETTKRKREGGKLILARGEATGHHHFIQQPDAELFEGSDQQIFLHCTVQVEVEHQEHQPITLPIGDYQIIPVQEYDHFKEEASGVVD